MRNRRMLVTSTELMMIQFLVPHVQYLTEQGWEIEVACSNVGGRIDEVRDALKGIAKVHVVELYRNPAKPQNLKGLKQMKKLINSKTWDVIWTNEPVMGVMTRLAAKKARKAGTKVVYMCHGFHFYKGAPLKNWLVFYPIERVMSRFTDTLVTLNHDDFSQAEKMHAKTVRYIHGIGMNTNRFGQNEHPVDIRKELGISEDDFLVFSVGELNDNKNHKTVIKAIGKLKDPSIHYAIGGKGDKLHELQELAKQEGLSGHVHFLGYRKDVVDIYYQSDIFAFPSYREGLSLASLEAMYSGIPLVSSNVRGYRDYMKQGKTGFICRPDDVEGFSKAIKRLKEDTKLRDTCGSYNKKAVRPFLLESVKDEILQLFENTVK